MRRFIIAASLGALFALGSAFAQPTYPQTYGQPPDTLVQTWYQKYLHRMPEYGGMQNWVNALNSGQSPQVVQAQILGSQEYANQNGNTPEGFVQGMFRDVVGRRPTPQEYSYWLAQAQNMSPADTANAFLGQYAPSGYPSSSYSSVPSYYYQPAPVRRWNWRPYRYWR